MGEKRIIWIDVESTGVDAFTKDSLLEIACLITDKNLNILDEKGFRAVIKYSPEEVEALKAHTVPFVLDMHTKTGLWDELPTGTPLQEVDESLLSYIKQFVPKENTARLAGNSITLDRNFMNRYLPESFAHIKYRSYDVSTLAGLAEMWYDDIPHFVKKKTHAAMDDIRESINELVYYRQVMLRQP